MRILMVLLGTLMLAQTRAAERIHVRVVSSHPDTVSGGDVLVELRMPIHTHWVARLNGRNVSASFHTREESRAPDGSEDLLARLTALKEGRNRLEIRANGAVKSDVELSNHPSIGPIFSGPHQEPFICQTEANGLGPETDGDCNAKTLVQYYYRSTEKTPDAAEKSPTAMNSAFGGFDFGPGFKAYDTSRPPPTDVAQTVTSDGHRVPYIFRREIGTINRAVYEILILHQPGQPLPNPWMPPTPGWNGQLVYLFGGGSGAGHHQGILRDSQLEGAMETPLALGYAVATSTLNIAATTTNDVLSAETLSMVKEYFTKQFGEPTHTIGWGASGGAMLLHLIAQNYPGLLDGIVVWGSFPDMASYIPTIGDCALLNRTFNSTTQHWSEPQKTAVSGLATWRACDEAVERGRVSQLDPILCDPSIPHDVIYDKTANPRGVRCDFYDNEVNVLGRDPRTGFARRAFDNVGVQYGLIAFKKRQINAEQFLELNENIGGYDDDGQMVPSRTAADSEALRRAYGHGLVLTGRGGLGQIPIIDWLIYADDLADVHDHVRSLVTRARLVAANGSSDNHVVLVYPRYPLAALAEYIETKNNHVLITRQERFAVTQMSHWLDGLTADGSPTSSSKLLHNRPPDLADSCWSVDGERSVEPATYGGSGKCNQLYPLHGDPRLAAGEPLPDDILKCDLKPVNEVDYSEQMTIDQLERLKSIFSSGVCDYSRPGIAQTVTQSTWQHF